MPDARCTRGLVCKIVRRDAHEHTGSAEAIRHSLRNGFTAYAALPGDEFVLSPLPADLWLAWARLSPTCLRRLDTSNGCQDHTVLPYALAPFVLRAVARSRKTALRTHARRRHRVHRIPSHVRDDARPPLVEG
jgi:hypothetical protein